MRENLSVVVRRHRTGYHYGSNWIHVLLSFAPWLGVLLVAALLYVSHDRLSIAPGVIFELPRAPLTGGAAASLTALMLPVSRDLPGAEETLVFFDDDRFSLLDPEQRTSLGELLRERMASSQKKGEFLLLVDKRIPHGDVVRFVDLAHEVGIERVNIAVKPE
ncbi:MAG: biopolymer transporter ExbD [Kiritimatiellae bacterium]|nr:biopolymer transporter ExbD [Kiritimatiellia bacterium]